VTKRWSAPKSGGYQTKQQAAKRERLDWSAFDAMTAEERHAAAMSDPDCQPMTEEDFASGRYVRRKPRQK
jgi:hypothetical protein